MSNPVHAAVTLLNELGWSDPSDMTMEDIAWAKGLIVRYSEMDGSQGRILMTKDEAIITINSAITYQPKINYIIAHEIGHSQLHRQLSLFNDSDKTLSEWYAQGRHENEANTFAAELLMPRDLFVRKVKKKKLEVQLIEGVAEYFKASKTAAFLRYRDLGDFPVMIIFIEDGIIKWKSCSEDFPYKWLTIGSKLPAYTVAGDCYYRQVEEKKPAKVDALEWFPEDYACQRAERAKLWEQCFPSTKDSIVTCLWTA
ncbi:ImmA/IrrE family metallo-endopeptidase [Terrimonas pollutisoli]|uniref:ImmA/IrrE family metallo-endopeptidase n=1 Tax=Terrimonas pollutisoli TaxID=3034147 RepID=UPI0023ECB7B0|nr:ImmA/IrrE family metallo-endopeptidase [Terrimonas sp. H1YJ31]